MSGPPRHTPFFSATADATAPLWLWALHFFASYAATSAGCELGWDAGVLKSCLLAGSAAALALGAWLLVRACRMRRRETADLLNTARLACATLALIGIAWASLPPLLLPTCAGA